MGHADRGTMGHLIIAPWSLLLVCLPKKLVELLIKYIDVAIFDYFVKYQRIMIRLPNYKVKLP